MAYRGFGCGIAFNYTGHFLMNQYPYGQHAGCPTTYPINLFDEGHQTAATSMLQLITAADWRLVLSAEFKKTYMENLCNKLKGREDISPCREFIFQAFNETPLYTVKVVLMGQDPYEESHIANGLAFASQTNYETPPSLKKIYKKLEKDIPSYRKPEDGEYSNNNLKIWAEQGVLLLNTWLTNQTRMEDSLPIKHGWEIFTDRVIEIISHTALHDIVFILLGNEARKKEILIDQQRHAVVKSAHPIVRNKDFIDGPSIFKTEYKKINKLYVTPEVEWEL